MEKPWKKTKEGIELFIKLTPNASRDKVLGIQLDSEGNPFLKASVVAIAENNKANQSLINLLSKKLHIARSQITIKSGNTTQRKTLILEEVEEERLLALLAEAKGIRSKSQIQ